MSHQKSITNERELVSKLTEWFNEVINRNKFPFKEATNESPAKSDLKTYFGDIVLWKNRQALQAYTYIEIKPPFAAKEDINTFKKKAISYKIKYCFTWDFQNLNVYELKNNVLELINSEPTPIMREINEWLRGDIQTVIKKQISLICEEVIHLSETGKLRKFTPDKFYFVNLIRDVVERLVPQFEKHYSDIAKDRKKRTQFTAYATSQGIALSNDRDYFILIARQSVYSLVTKIIFYLTIRRYFDDLPDLYIDDEPDLERYLKIAFARAQERDWQAVFEESEIESFGIPKSCYQDLRDFFSEMKVYHFGELPEDVIGELFEEIIDPEKRHLLGQYFTNENLIDLILGFVVNDANAVYADTTCGSGTFLIRLYDRLKHLSKRLTHTELLDKIWGFDIAKFPAELSTINLYKQDVSNFENFPRVRRTNIFNVNKGDSYEFPPAAASKHFKKVEIKLPQFSSIVGNFPFIKQELIEKEIKGYKLELAKVLAYNYFLSYPKLFSVRGINGGVNEYLKTLDFERYKKEIDKYVERGNLQLKLSGRADIYTYIFIHTTTLLAEKGSFAVITSNSWLDTEYGSVLKEFFLDNFKIKAVIASWAEPWFDDAAVNTVVTVLEKETDKEKRDSNITRFIKLKKKLSDLIPYHDLKLESHKRWNAIDRIVDIVDSAEFNAKKELITENISSLNIPEMRIRLVKQSYLYTDLIEKNERSKWGKYLRAPDVYFEILEKCKDKLVPLHSIADVKFGIKTGINEFFYLEPIENDKKVNGCFYCRNGRGWQGYIEEKFLKPVIKSPKESESITIDASKLKYRIFLCNKSKNDLKKAGDKYALKYIEWGEKQNTKDGKSWKEVPSVSGRTFWWGINIREFPKILWTEMYFDSFRTMISESEILESDKFYRIETKEYIKFGLYLNSSLINLFREITAFSSLGDGVLKTPVYEVENLLVPKKLPNFSKPNYKNLLNRNIYKVFKEVKQKDRIELDSKILEVLGLDPRSFLPRIYEGLNELVMERIELPKMRKRKQKEDIKYAHDKVKEDVIADCLEHGIRVFPHDFYTMGDYDSLDFESFATDGTQLKMEAFFGNIQLKNEKGVVIHELDSEIKGEFAVLMSRNNIYSIKIPQKEKIVSQIIKNYKTYIKKLKEQLEANAKEKTHDWAKAEKIASEILNEYGLPE